MPVLIIALILLLIFGSRLLPGLGSSLGRKARKPYRQARWLWQSTTGTEEDSIRAEREYGRECAREFLGQFPAKVPPGEQQLVSAIGSRLARAAEDPRLEFRCTVIASEVPNAYALPGGFVFITRGLLGVTGGDRDTVAFFLGHEVAHVTCGHAKERFAAQTLLGAVSGRMTGAGVLLRQLLDKGYSRALEQEADREAVRLMRAAGFDARASIRALERLGRTGRDTRGLAEYFSTHPSFADRISDLENLAG